MTAAGRRPGDACRSRRLGRGPEAQERREEPEFGPGRGNRREGCFGPPPSSWPAPRQPRSAPRAPQAGRAPELAQSRARAAPSAPVPMAAYEEVSVLGFEEFGRAVERHQGKTIFAYFTGSKDAEGKSWCPDCELGEPGLPSWAVARRDEPEERRLRGQPGSGSSSERGRTDPTPSVPQPSPFARFTLPRPGQECALATRCWDEWDEFFNFALPPPPGIVLQET